MPHTPSIREMLRMLLNEHGIELCFSAMKCKTLLADNTNGQPHEIYLLVSAVEREIPSEMLRLGQLKKTMPVSVLLPKLSRWMTRESVISYDDGRWAVDSWAMGLGIIPYSELALPAAL